MKIHKRVAFGVVFYLAGLVLGVALLPLHDLGAWPIVAWTAFCAVVGLVAAEIRALASAMNNLPMDRARAPIKARSVPRRLHRR